METSEKNQEVNWLSEQRALWAGPEGLGVASGSWCLLMSSEGLAEGQGGGCPIS